MVPLSFLLRLITLIVVLGAAPVGARADEDFDHDLARDLHERGEILSFQQIARAALRAIPGDIVGVGLKQIGQRWTYVIQIVDAAGHRVTLDIDAESATLLDRSPAGGGQP
jgi:uncharacterized membrane protein YkoI